MALAEPARDATGNPVESAFYVTVSFTLQAKVGARGGGWVLGPPIVPVAHFAPALKLQREPWWRSGCGPAWNAAKPENGN